MTINFDHINGAFETVGGLICWLNFRRLRKDKEVKGVDWRVAAFFATWGWWNLAYYPSLSQWASFAGGCLLVLANTAWVLQALQYRARNGQVSRKVQQLDKIQDQISGYLQGERARRQRIRAAAEAVCPEFFAELEADKKSLARPVVRHAYKPVHAGHHNECECDICVEKYGPRDL